MASSSATRMTTKTVLVPQKSGKKEFLPGSLFEDIYRLLLTANKPPAGIMHNDTLCQCQVFFLLYSHTPQAVNGRGFTWAIGYTVSLFTLLTLYIYYNDIEAENSKALGR